MALARVLVAEDDPDILKVIRMSLKFGGVRDIVTAENGEECLARLRDGRPDVILLDVMMPKLDGYETCRQLKADPATADIPVIFLTAKTQQAEAKRGLDVGALGYLLKPFDPMRLHRDILQLLEAKVK